MEQAGLLAFVAGFDIVDFSRVASLDELPEEATGDGVVNREILENYL